MSVFRIVKRTLYRNGEVRRKGPFRPVNPLPEIARWFWKHGIKLIQYKDFRMRDKHGNLAGYCSEMEKKRHQPFPLKPRRA